VKVFLKGDLLIPADLMHGDRLQRGPNWSSYFRE